MIHDVDHWSEVTQTPKAVQQLWRLDPLGILVQPLALAADELAALSALLDEASVPTIPAADTGTGETVLPLWPENDTGPLVEPAASNGHHLTTDDLILGERTQVTPAAPGGDPAPTFEAERLTGPGPVFTTPPWQVMVRLLGPVDLIGHDGRAPASIRDRTIEIIAWLVLHPHGTRPQLESALWPTGARASTVANTLSRARTALEELAGPEAHEWIPTYQSELRINSAVTTDLALLQAHIDWAVRQRSYPRSAISALREGLSLVRGVPEGYPWLDAEHGSTLTTTITTAAIRLATMCLDQGDFDAAVQATVVGLAVLPAHPELFALRMRARAAAGDRSGVRAEYDAYLRAENADPMADGETDRDLEHLYLQLTRTLSR